MNLIVSIQIYIYGYLPNLSLSDRTLQSNGETEITKYAAPPPLRYTGQPLNTDHGYNRRSVCHLTHCYRFPTFRLYEKHKCLFLDLGTNLSFYRLLHLANT